jgi:hypothetical protein
LYLFQYWKIVAFTTAEEYDLEKLSEGLLQQNLYVPNPPPRALTDGSKVGKRHILLCFNGDSCKFLQVLNLLDRD